MDAYEIQYKYIVAIFFYHQLANDEMVNIGSILCGSNVFVMTK